jgi:hypothetical protein
MKHFYLLALSFVAGLEAKSQIKAGFSYSLSLPQHEMKNNIRPIHSLNVNFISRFKPINNLYWGVEIGFGQYAGFTKEQEIRLPDGSGFDGKVSYSSNVVTAGLVARYEFFKEAKVNPFITGKLGYANFFSAVIVNDPNNADDCKPLERKTPIADHSFFASYGAGLQVDVSTRRRPNHAWMYVSVSQMHGTSLDYINVREVKDPNHDMSQMNNPPDGSEGRRTPLKISFINVATQSIHQHQLATVYNSPLRLLEMKLGVMWRLGN